jgi:AGCS family alanine or glycine:cation symporter
MKRALFSSEAGQGSSPIAHSAAKTHEPVREGVVAGLEPFVDTIVVCTVTSLVILSSGAWNRGAEATYAEVNPASVVQAGEPGKWTIDVTDLPERRADAQRIEGDWSTTAEFTVFMRVDTGVVKPDKPQGIDKLIGTVAYQPELDKHVINWDTIEAPEKPELLSQGLYVEYAGASLTSHAFNRVYPGLGKYLIVIASWLFAISTMISWSYYGEQGVVFLFGEKAVMPYKFVYCFLILVASLGFIETEKQLDGFTALGTGVMLWANIPIMLIFGSQAMKAFHNYFDRLKRGEFSSEEREPPAITDIVEGRDTE